MTGGHSGAWGDGAAAASGITAALDPGAAGGAAPGSEEDSFSYFFVAVDEAFVAEAL